MDSNTIISQLNELGETIDKKLKLMKIIPQDVYLPVEVNKDTGYSVHTSNSHYGITNVEKHIGMIVLTVEEFQWHVDEFKATAFDEGYREGVHDSKTKTLK